MAEMIPLEAQPQSIGFVALLPGGMVATAYYNADAQDLAVMAHNIQSDVTLKIIENNIDTIREWIEETEEEE